MSKIKIGTRGSTLARQQTHWVIQLLQLKHPELCFEEVVIKTQGDILPNASSQNVGNQGIFVKEIEKALMAGHIDLAVHSMKDVPIQMPDELLIAAVPKREDARDALVTCGKGKLDELPAQTKLGTSSQRRIAQILQYRPDFLFVQVRGNIETRIAKLKANEVEGLILAVAGLRRLGLAEHIAEILSMDIMVPAVGQGALALQTRSDDDRIISLARDLNHDASFRAIAAERAFLTTLHGGCKNPIAAYAWVKKNMLSMVGRVILANGCHSVSETIVEAYDEPVRVGEKLAERMLQRGAKEILEF